MKSFEEIVEAIQENNRINDGKWSDWENFEHVEEVYGKYQGENYEAIRAFINALIRKDGDNLSIFLDAARALEYDIVITRD